MLRGDDLFLFAANAYDPDSCVGTEGPELTTDDLRAFEPVLDRMAAGSRLPAPSEQVGS